MRNKYGALLLAVAVGVTAAGCAGKSAKERVAAQRQQWEESLKDSVATAERQVDSVKNRISALRESTDKLLRRFRCVDNPKEVEKYYLPEVAGFSYPLTSTGLAARVMANEQFELVAAYQGASFTNIRIQADGKQMRTHAVAPDQGLNYRSGNMTTISFTGRDVDSLAYMLADISVPVVVTYMEGERRVGEIKLSGPQTEALRLSAALASERRETLLSEKLLTLMSHKLGMLKAKVTENSGKGEE